MSFDSSLQWLSFTKKSSTLASEFHELFFTYGSPVGPSSRASACASSAGAVAPFTITLRYAAMYWCARIR